MRDIIMIYMFSYILVLQRDILVRSLRWLTNYDVVDNKHFTTNRNRFVTKRDVLINLYSTLPK